MGTDHIDNLSKTAHLNSGPDIEEYTTIRYVSISLQFRRRTRGHLLNSHVQQKGRSERMSCYARKFSSK